MHKKVASIVTAAVLLVTMSANVAIADPLSDKLNEQKQVHQQHKNDYENVQRKLASMEEQIEHFDAQIESLMSEIEDNKSKIKNISSDIKSTQKEIEQAKEDLEEEQELYNQRMRTMYMNGVGGYLEVILGAESLSDLVAKVEAVQKLTDLDKKIVSELNQKQEELSAKQESLKEEQTKLQNLNASQEKKVKQLESDKAKQNSLIAEVRAQSAAYSDMLEEDQANIAETMRLINAAKERVKSSKGKNSSGKSSSSNSSRPSRGSSSNASGDAVIAYASQFLGTPYVWAANGPNSFDCSGFTKYVYAHFGVDLPRVSRDQAEVGAYVEKSDLQPGDLVFFKNGSSPVHHVGIYVGNGSYIHAPRTGDVVKISSLSSRSDYAWARRVLN